MKPLLKICLFLLLPVFAMTQQNPYAESWSDKQIDSLRIILQHTSNDTVRMRISRSMGWYYQERNRDSSLYFHEQELTLSRKLKLKLWEADALDQAGWVLSQLKNYPLSLQYFLDAIKIAENPDCEKNIWQPGIFAEEKNPSTARLTVYGFIYNDMSQLYKAIGNDEKGLSSLLQSLKIGESINNYTMLSTVSVNLAEIYLKINKQDSALFYAQRAVEYMDTSGYSTYTGYAFAIYGYVYLKQNNYPLAKEYFEKSVFENKKQSNKTGLPYSYLGLADLFKATGKPDSSIYYTKKALADYRNVGLLAGVNNCYASLYSLYKLTGNNDSAFQYIQLYKILNDSLNLTEKEKINEYQDVGFNEKIKMQELQNEQTRRENSFRTYLLLTGIGVFMLIAFLLYRNNRNRRKANELLQKQKEEIEIQKRNVEGTLSELKATQTQLIQSEKMASLGELTAGIAHEIQNPLNFVNNFSEVSNELIDEMNVELDKGDIEEAKVIAGDVKSNLEKINHHGKRADAIVKGMLQHSPSSSGVKEPTDINALCDEYLRLTYHGLRAKNKSFNATMKTDFDNSIGNINIIPQDIGRVILNLLTNAFYVVNEKKHQHPELDYEPTVTIKTTSIHPPSGGRSIQIKVSDNGGGIPQKLLDKIFQPFFTTKPTGQGTGLGLSLSYDIVTKGHSGELKVETKEARPDDPVGRGEGTTFIISLPINNN
ncbi:MAG: ATP-binding protein [Chitinophagaceae bacterium]